MQKIGMSLGMSPASVSLGLGSALSDQVNQETEEERRKRLMAAAQNGPASALFGSAANAVYR